MSASYGLRRRLELGEIAAPAANADQRQRELLSRKGDEHEQRYLAKLIASGASVEELPARVGNDETFAAAQDRTLAAIERGPAYIFQPTFFDGTFLGRADFLRRVDRPCAARGWSYEVIDTKLARSTKAYFLVQLSSYSEHLAGLQGGTMPERMHVALGSGEERSFFTRDYLAYYRRLRASFLARGGGEGDLSERMRPLQGLRLGAHVRPATARRRSFVAGGMDAARSGREADERRRRNAYGASEAPRTMRGRAGSTPTPSRACAFRRRCKSPGRTARKHHFCRTKPRGGLALLPEPDAGDVYFDMEGDPYFAPDTGLEYLFGAYLPNENRYVPFWAASAALEKRAMTDFLDFVIERRARFPNLHVYHYANYEKAALGRLTMRYAARAKNSTNCCAPASSSTSLRSFVKASAFRRRATRSRSSNRFTDSSARRPLPAVTIRSSPSSNTSITATSRFWPTSRNTTTKTAARRTTASLAHGIARRPRGGSGHGDSMVRSGAARRAGTGAARAAARDG